MKRAQYISGQEGFSLMEMMIATVIFLLLCGAAFALLSVAQQRYQTESQVLNSFQEARFGLEEIVRDVNGAGYPPENQFTPSANPAANLYASTPIAWDPNYVSNSPCQIGTAGGGTCNPTPGDFDIIIERDVDPWRHDGVEWTRYQLQGTVLSRSQTYKVVNQEPDPTTAPSFVPYVQNVMNNASAAQIAQFRTIYSQMFPGGNPVPVFQYLCGTPTGPQSCPTAASVYNSPVNVTDVEVTLIVMAPTLDASTGLPRLIELHGRGHTLNPIQ
ncbi:MAG TPA: prepilin-type N-terminal cleavage/methylation domain-containing protein [Candidatus Methylomirabilis sp.]|nr:prepilin-type N-terminal cleavage/methylation domain-containing protein [Candidatus Methylomirabilis sp.]